MLTPDSPTSTLSKTGPKLIASLKHMGIATVADLLAYYPTRYLDFTKFTQVAHLVPGETVTVRGTIKTISSRFSFKTRKMLAEAILSDSTGSIKVTWFNQAYVADALANGDEVLLSGKVDSYKGLQLTNPIYEKVSNEHIHTGRLVPVYKLPDTIYPKTFRKLVFEALPAAAKLEDILPKTVRIDEKVMSAAEATQELHFPTSTEKVTQAHERLAFAESFIQQLAVQHHKLQLRKLAAPSIVVGEKRLLTTIRALPFTLTQGQSDALRDIVDDLAHKHPMNRLLQGDVGSGKTIVALLAALEVVHAGYQVVLLAPTEVLAKQHFESITKQLVLLEKDVHTALFTRNFQQDNSRPVTKKELQTSIQNGMVSLIIGTHTLIQDSTRFAKLALVIIDEQHRFGVEQRRALTTKFNNANNAKGRSAKKETYYPHLLSMTATPIPRTAALTLYGDLEISSIDVLPQNRLPIKTWVVPEQKRAGAYEFIQKEVAAGRQAFIITPLVEDSAVLETKAVKSEFERLQKQIFPKLKLGLLYGSMKGTDKDKVMELFSRGEIDILVSTSVVEVGIDIPNASTIVIEGADRFGLAQLHQLRGRVGRGAHQSYCFLFSETPSSQERLNFFAHTRSGFALADFDMQSRGFGSLFGTTQTGFDFKYGKYLTLSVLEKAKRAASLLITKDPELDKHHLLKAQVMPLSNTLHME